MRQCHMHHYHKWNIRKICKWVWITFCRQFLWCSLQLVSLFSSKCWKPATTCLVLHVVEYKLISMTFFQECVSYRLLFRLMLVLEFSVFWSFKFVAISVVEDWMLLFYDLNILRWFFIARKYLLFQRLKQLFFSLG